MIDDDDPLGAALFYFCTCGTALSVVYKACPRRDERSRDNSLVVLGGWVKKLAGTTMVLTRSRQRQKSVNSFCTIPERPNGFFTESESKR